jgi:hypothetical protein
LFDSVHSKPVPSVDKGVPPSKLLDEGLVEVGLLGKVQLGDAPFRDNTAVVGLCFCSVVHWPEHVGTQLTPMISSSLFSCVGRTWPLPERAPDLGERLFEDCVMAAQNQRYASRDASASC